MNDYFWLKLGDTLLTIKWKNKVDFHWNTNKISQMTAANCMSLVFYMFYRDTNDRKAMFIHQFSFDLNKRKLKTNKQKKSFCCCSPNLNKERNVQSVVSSYLRIKRSVFISGQKVSLLALRTGTRTTTYNKKNTWWNNGVSLTTANEKNGMIICLFYQIYFIHDSMFRFILIGNVLLNFNQ